MLRSLESGTSARESIADEWSRLGPTHAEFDTRLQSRFDGAVNEPANTDDAADVLVRLESLAGVESPTSERQRRMDQQVRRLSSRLRGGATQDAESELAAVIAEWFALGPVSGDGFDERFDRAVRAAVDNLP